MYPVRSAWLSNVSSRMPREQVGSQAKQDCIGNGLSADAAIVLTDVVDIVDGNEDVEHESLSSLSLSLSVVLPSA